MNHVKRALTLLQQDAGPPELSGMEQYGINTDLRLGLSMPSMRCVNRLNSYFVRLYPANQYFHVRQPKLFAASTRHGAHMHAVSKSADHSISHRRWRNSVSNGEDAVQTLDKATLDYILSDPRASEALRRLVRAPTDPVPRLHYVRAAQGQLIYQIAVDEVLFFRAENKYTVVKTPAGEHLIRTPVAELVQLLDSDQFWQVHRSTLINLKYLVGIRRDRASRLFVQIRGHDQELPVSRAHAHLFKAM